MGKSAARAIAISYKLLTQPPENIGRLPPKL